jgi:hypothetical protein
MTSPSRAVRIFTELAAAQATNARRSRVGVFGNDRDYFS